MPGQFNASDTDDGLTAFTASSAKSGVFGRNNSTDAAVGAGGAGVFGLTVSAGAAGVFGANNGAKGVGVQGNGPEAGVSGFSESGAGVRSHSNHANAVEAFSHDSKANAVLAINDATAEPVPNSGSPQGCGILAVTNVPGAAGVFGSNNSAKGTGVQGNGPERGISGFSDAGFGAAGQSNRNAGVLATSGHGQGLSAFSDNDVAIFGQGATFSGVFNGALVVNKGPNPKDPAVRPSDINGSVVINEGNLFLKTGHIFGGPNTKITCFDVTLAGADCAENFDIAGSVAVDAGSVMVVDEDGMLSPCSLEYDRRVAGVVSGAGAYKPGILLGQEDSTNNRQPIALVGKVYCKATAREHPISVGDLLTTSSTLGHAMKAADPAHAFGAVVGKALQPLSEGVGEIAILIALQ
jgi:hypothetical protein